MNIQEYIASQKAKKTPADILQRWQSRIVPRQLHEQGAAGAQVYIRDYAQTAGAPKLLAFAQLAMSEGYESFAEVFYLKAAELEGVAIEVSDAGNAGAVWGETRGPQGGKSNPIAKMLILNPAFPAEKQPGRLVPMQPADGARDRDYYIAHSGYWGQPKVDGNKLIVFASNTEVYYQSRTLKLSGTPDATLDDALKSAAAEIGSFILEGELTYLDAKGYEHRTGSQAASVNIELGYATIPPEMRYKVFSCLWRINEKLDTYGDMVNEGENIAEFIASDLVRPVGTARSIEAKQALVADQQKHDREGEVWFLPNYAYRVGKQNDETFVRTKYLTEFEALVVGFTATTAAGHAFGAMKITDLNGKDLGEVGTGFTREEKQMLCNTFAAYGPFKVNIVSQKFTEAGKAWHARFINVVA